MHSIVFALRIGEHIYYRGINSGERCTIGGHRKDDLQIEGWQKHQISLQANGGSLSLQSLPPLSYNCASCPMEQILPLNKDKSCQLMACNRPGKEAQELQLPFNGVIHFGRGTRNNVVLALPFISKDHFLIRMDAGTARVEDNDSTHGIYINGRRVRAGVLRTGDVLQIWTVRIVLENGKLHFENTDGRLRINQIADRSADSHASGVPADRQGAFILYHRSPRMQEQLPKEQIVLANPPGKTQAYERRRSALMSLLGPGIMVAANVATMGAASPALLLARSAGMVSPLVSAVSYGGMDKKQRKRLEQYEALRRQRFGAYIEDQKRHIDEVAEHQRNIITRENPSPAQCMKTVSEVRRSLWERMPSDRDYLDVRLGMGYERLCVPVTTRAEAAGFRMEDDEMEQVVRQIVEETEIVDRIPARLPLLRYQTIGIVGGRRRAIQLVQSMITELTCQQSPQNIQLVGIFDREEMGAWAPIRWLPHIWDAEGQFRYIAFDEKRAHTVCELLGETLKRRLDAASKNQTSQKMPAPQPYYVVILGSKTLTRQEPIMRLLTQNNPALGTSTIFLFDDLYSLPQECRFIVEVDNDPCAYDRLDISQKFFFTPDTPPDEDQFDQYTRQMSAIRAEELTQTAGIPDSVTFLQGYGVRHPEELRVIDRWRDSKPYQTLAVPIGVLAGGKTLYFDIQDGKHGPHGLVAGTTGAGKSELLQSWILSMAVNFHPHDVNFVIIDYKGGGMANLMEPLPHVVGKITNLGSSISRSLVALTAENQRRQQIFERYGVNDIKKYQKLYREGRADQPLPYLIIVADEFAELKREQSDFMDSLISIARIGRSLGVCLLLATQQPSGVVSPQIESNSRFRICLKMNSAEDSSAILHHTDAARITHPGRAYLRVGTDEIFDLFQSYWSGALYRENDEPVNDRENRVCIINTTGERIQPVRSRVVNRDSDGDELAAVVRYICRESSQAGIQPLPGPWMEELPEQLPLERLLPESAFNGADWGQDRPYLSIPIGLYDDPAHQQQSVEYIHLAKDGHCGIYGAPMTGKTSLLRTFLLSLAMTHTPAEAQVYIIDCGWGLSGFGELPHVGGIVLPYEDEKRGKLQALLMAELERRKKLFSSCGVGSLSAYRQTVSEDLAAVVLVIDDITALFESFPTEQLCEKFEKFLATLAREGAAYGMYLIYTANSFSGIRNSIRQNVRSCVALQLKDVGEYTDLVGHVKSALPPIPGRAYGRGNPPLEFQTALYLDYPTEPAQHEALARLAQSMDRCWTGTRPRCIPVLMDRVSMADMEYIDPTCIPLGQDFQTLDTAYADLSFAYSLMVCGPDQTANGSYLELLCRVLSRRPDNQLYIVDSSDRTLISLRSCAAEYAVCTDQESVQHIITALCTILNQRVEEQQNGGCTGPQLCLILNDLSALLEGITNEQLHSIIRFCYNAQGLGLIILASATTAYLDSHSHEPLTEGIISNKNAVAIGGELGMYGCFCSMSTLVDHQPGIHDAFLFTDGNCHVIRRME